MSANEREKLGLPAAMMDVIMTPSPALNNISAPELSAATTEVCAAFFCEQGTLSMGAPLIRHYGRAMANWIVPPIEMKGNKRWEDPVVKSIAIKLGNWDRKDARVCGSLTPGHRMCVLFPAQHSDSNASLMYVVVQIMYRAGITIALADMSEKARANVADYPIFVVDEDAPAKYTRRLLPGESKSSGGEQQAEGAALPTATTAPNLTGAPPVLAVTAAPVSTGGLLTIPKPPNFNGFPVAMATPLQNSSVQLVPPPAPPAVIFFEDDNAEPMNSGQMAHGAAVTHAQAAPTALSPGSQYEARRQVQIEENKRKLEAMGIEKLAPKAKKQARVRKPRVAATAAPTRSQPARAGGLQPLSMESSEEGEQHAVECTPPVSTPPETTPPETTHWVKGDRMFARDRTGSWYKAKVVDVCSEGEERKLFVHFLGWKSKWDEWIKVGTGRLKLEGGAPSMRCASTRWRVRGIGTPFAQQSKIGLARLG